MKTATIRKRVRLQPDARRSQLLDAAAAVVERDGSAACSMEGVAAEAGVSKGLVYVYFADRTALLIALFEREWAYQTVRAADVIDTAPTLAEKVVGSLRVYLDAMEQRGAVYHMLVSEPSVDAELERKRAANADARARYWIAAMRRELEVDAVTATLLAEQFQAAANAVVRRWLRGEITRALAEDTWSRFVLAGLNAFARERRRP